MQKTYRSRLCYVVIDVNDLDEGERFWAGALSGEPEPVGEASEAIYRRLRLPHSDLRLLLQLVPEPKTAKNRVHLDIESDDVEAEVTRLEALGASRVRHETDRGFDFWILADPFGNELCVLQPEYPGLLCDQPPQR